MKKAPENSNIHAILEPRSDWAPLDQAPYYCFRNGFIQCWDEWKIAAVAQAEEIMRSTEFKSNDRWSVSAKMDGIDIQSAGILTTISPDFACVRPVNDSWSIVCSPCSLWGSGGLLTQPQWAKELRRAGDAEREAALQHKRLLEEMSRSWRSNFLTAFANHRVQIMARKNSIFAPFESVGLDQWLFFRLDEPSEEPSPRWNDPRKAAILRTDFSTCTATGPAGERLFAIYAVPTFGTPSVLSLDQKCHLYIRDLIENHPIKAPKKKSDFIDEVADRFPGLSRNRIQNIMLVVMNDMGRIDWFPVGRPPLKSLQKSPRKK
jgi:hypothetical protein